MTNTLERFAWLLLASAIVTACGAPPDGATTVELTRLDSGELAYCKDGACRQVPYGGACESVLLDIDLEGNEICQRCVLAGGEILEQGCDVADDACVTPEVRDAACVEARSDARLRPAAPPTCDAQNEAACIPVETLAGGPGWFRN